MISSAQISRSKHQVTQQTIRPNFWSWRSHMDMVTNHGLPAPTTVSPYVSEPCEDLQVPGSRCIIDPYHINPWTG